MLFRTYSVSTLFLQSMISDGGLIVSVLDMAFSANCGVKLNIDQGGKSLIQTLLAKELGIVIKVDSKYCDVFKQKLVGTWQQAFHLMLLYRLLLRRAGTQ